jgi:hypothetical protein
LIASFVQPKKMKMGPHVMMLSQLTFITAKLSVELGRRRMLFQGKPGIPAWIRS